MKRHNIEFIWGWFDALRRRDTESMAAAGVVWQGARPDLVCHGPAEVIAAFVTAYDANREIDSLELLCGDGHIVLGARAPELAVADVDTGGEIYEDLHDRGAPARRTCGAQKVSGSSHEQTACREAEVHRFSRRSRPRAAPPVAQWVPGDANALADCTMKKTCKCRPFESG
jgi:hypothetical protein